MALNRASLPCPNCGSLITKVTSSLRSEEGATYRYRKCEFCNWSYRTMQFAEVIVNRGEVKTTHNGHMIKMPDPQLFINRIHEALAKSKNS